LSQETNTYVITLPEFPALNMLMQTQKRLGSGTTLSSPDDVPEYFRIMMNLGWLHIDVKNPILLSLYEKMFTKMKSMPNSAEMDLVAQFFDFCMRTDIEQLPDWARTGPPHDPRWPWKSYWSVYYVGFLYMSHDDQNTPGLQWKRYESSVMSPNHPTWKADLDTVLKKWQFDPPGTFIDPGTKLGDKYAPARAAEAKLIKWGGENNVPRKAIEPMEALLKDTVKVMMKESSLSVDSHLLLLHLLICLANSNGDDRNMAARIVNLRTDSMEYQNDIFINQLIYLVLISLIDPKGIYKQKNEKIISKMEEIRNYIVRTDGAAQAIKQSISESIDMLNADPSFPMQDANNPNIQFSSRKTDTLEALDVARKSFTT